MRKIGIQTDSAFDNKDFDRGFEFMKKCGFDSADFTALMDPASELGSLPDAELSLRLRGIKRAADSAGIEIYQMHGIFVWPITNSTAEERKSWTDFAKKSIIAAAELGNPRFVIHPMMPFGPSGDEDREVYLKVNREFLCELCETAKEVGTVICLENMPFVKQSLHTPVQVRDFIKEIPYGNIEACLDTGHALYVGLTLEESVRELGSCIGALHVHDNFGSGDQHMMPFAGKGDWSGFAKAMRECVSEAVPLILETSPSKKLPHDIFEHLLVGYAKVAKHLVNMENE